jgi:sugar lactone lactonase YvrE
VGQWTIPGGQAPERVAVAGGKVYVTTGSDTVWRFDTNGAVDSGWDGDGVLGSSGTGAGQFDFPEGVAVDGSGVYVADGSNNRVEKFDFGGGFMTMWGWGVADGADAFETCSANCQAGKLGSGAGEFFEPYGILATGGAVWVADAYNHRLQRFGQAGAHQLTVGAPPGAGDYYFPEDVATTASDHAYVADRSGHDIQELDGSGHTILRWATGPRLPFSVTPTANGVYAPEGNDHVSLYDSTGSLLSQFGSAGSGQGQLSFPSGSAADANGNLYVADRNNNRVQKFDPAGVPLAAFGSFGSGDGQLKAPRDVAVDSSGNVYVADGGNHRIEKFSPTGDFLSKSGSFGKGDGQLDTPTGVAVDATGHVFVSDGLNNRIQEFDADGSFVATWGALGGGPGELSDPGGLAVDPSPAVWVADTGNHRIVRFSFADANDGTSPGGGEPQPAPGGTTGDAGSPDAGAGVDTAAPRIRLSGRSTQRSLVGRRGLALRVSASERVKVTLRVILSRRDARRLGLRARSAARSSADLAAAGTQGLRLRLTARSRRALLRVQRVRLVVRATATDPAGNRSSDSLAITVTR